MKFIPRVSLLFIVLIGSSFSINAQTTGARVINGGAGTSPLQHGRVTYAIGNQLLFSNTIRIPAAEDQVVLYPNPASEYLIISGLSNDVASIRVFNHSGVLVCVSREISDRINVTALANGLYFLVLYDEQNEKLSTHKFIKN